eukprot:scaffold171921_cov39-Tisochrysis_lutea.AAC.2
MLSNEAAQLHRQSSKVSRTESDDCEDCYGGHPEDGITQAAALPSTSRPLIWSESEADQGAAQKPTNVAKIVNARPRAEANE